MESHQTIPTSPAGQQSSPSISVSSCISPSCPSCRNKEKDIEKLQEKLESRELQIDYLEATLTEFQNGFRAFVESESRVVARPSTLSDEICLLDPVPLPTVLTTRGSSSALDTLPNRIRQLNDRMRLVKNTMIEHINSGAPMNGPSPQLSSSPCKANMRTAYQGVSGLFVIDDIASEGGPSTKENIQSNKCVSNRTRAPSNSPAVLVPKLKNKHPHPQGIKSSPMAPTYTTPSAGGGDKEEGDCWDACSPIAEEDEDDWGGMIVYS